jgi:transcriptional regulator GlxA family with amidase domain
LYEKKDPTTIPAQKVLAINIIALLMELASEVKGIASNKSDKRLDDAVSYIFENYQRKILVSELAKICCLSIHHFERLFKNRYGQTPANYISRYRLAKAKELMHYTRMSLSEISERVGYSGIHAFSKAFKRTEGISPVKYLNNSQMPNPDK